MPSANDIAFESDGSVSLHFLPEFLANQVPGDPSPFILLRPLTSILAPDDPDRALCPVRALCYYLQRLRPLRSLSHRHLFVLHSISYARDIRKLRFLCGYSKW